MERISCPETSVRNYHYSLRNNPEERSSRIVSCQPTVLSRARSVQLNTIMRATSVEVRSMLRVHRIQLFLFNITDLAVGLCRLQELKLAGLSPRRPGFDLRPFSVGFISDKVALGQVFFPGNFVFPGIAVAQWLRCCAANRKVAGSIPAGVIGIFH